MLARHGINFIPLLLRRCQPPIANETRLEQPTLLCGDKESKHNMRRIIHGSPLNHSADTNEFGVVARQLFIRRVGVV